MKKILFLMFWAVLWTGNNAAAATIADPSAYCKYLGRVAKFIKK
jgi:hypothetical protein